MRVGSLFSGIGGLDLGLERAGMEIIWQVENDPYARKVLRNHWPNTELYGDIHEIEDFGLLPRVDLICGGFPCQPVSTSGRQKAQEDERWLWPKFAKAICQHRPRWVLVENVPGLLSTNNGGQWEKFSGTWPVAGMMWNGIVYQGNNSGLGIPDRDCSLLPTPTSSDWWRIKFSKEAIANNISRGHQLQLTALLILVGIPIQEFPTILEWMMGFPVNWTTDLNVSATLSSPRLRNGSVGGSSKRIKIPYK